MKRYLFPFLVVFICTFSVGLQAQEREWRVLVEQMAEEEGARADAVENLYEELLYLERYPMDLNRVSRDQLERFPLLSSEQVLSLMEFLEENRPLYTVYELRNVPRVDHRTVELILPFFRVDEAEGVRIQDWERVREQDRAWEKPLDFLKRLATRCRVVSIRRSRSGPVTGLYPIVSSSDTPTATTWERIFTPPSVTR